MTLKTTSDGKTNLTWRATVIEKTLKELPIVKHHLLTELNWGWALSSKQRLMCVIWTRTCSTNVYVFPSSIHWIFISPLLAHQPKIEENKYCANYQHHLEIQSTKGYVSWYPYLHHFMHHVFFSKDVKIQIITFQIMTFGVGVTHRLDMHILFICVFDH